MPPSNQRFLRQLDIAPPEKLAFPITVIGAGAIGSATVLMLAKMGASHITVWDDDILAEHNVPNQWCKPAAVGRPKVEALAELVWDLTEVRIQPRNERYRGQRLEGVVIAAVDSMTSRMEVWRRVKFDSAVTLLVDARMGAEFGCLYAIRPCDPEDVDFYTSNLYASGEAEQLPCRARSILYWPTVMASLGAVLVKRFALGDQLPSEILFDLQKPPTGDLGPIPGRVRLPRLTGLGREDGDAPLSPGDPTRLPGPSFSSVSLSGGGGDPLGRLSGPSTRRSRAWLVCGLPDWILHDLPHAPRERGTGVCLAGKSTAVRRSRWTAAPPDRHPGTDGSAVSQ